MSLYQGKAFKINTTMAEILGFDSVEEALEEYTDLSKDLYVNPDRRKEFVKLLKEKGEIRFDNKLLFHIINTTNDYFFDINKLARGEQFASKTIRKKKNGEIIQLSTQAFPVS